jgi:hypothetical protein
MRLDKHPKSVVCIMSAIGLFIIGAILTLAFFDNTTLLGVGVAMAVVGGAGAILGCINLLARRTDDKDDDVAPQGIAPPRIPPPKELFYGDSYDEANRGTLYYEPCTSSPPRALPHVDEDGIPMDGHDDDAGRRGFFDPSQSAAGGIIYVSPGKQPSAVINFPLSPMDRRSYPLPTGILQGGVSPPPQMAAALRSNSHNSAVGVDINARGFAPGAGHDSSVASTHNVDPISLSRNFAANSSSHPWQQGPPPPGMSRRPMHYDANVSMRTPRRGNDAESWSPQN